MSWSLPWCAHRRNTSRSCGFGEWKEERGLAPVPVIERKWCSMYDHQLRAVWLVLAPSQISTTLCPGYDPGGRSILPMMPCSIVESRLA